jgi:hypothetical protein
MHRDGAQVKIISDFNGTAAARDEVIRALPFISVDTAMMFFRDCLIAHDSQVVAAQVFEESVKLWKKKGFLDGPDGAVLRMNIEEMVEAYRKYPVGSYEKAILELLQ